MTEKYIKDNELNGTMKRAEIRFFSEIGGAVLALSLTLLGGLILARVVIQENLGIYLLLIMGVIIGIYFIFGAPIRR